MTLQERAKRYAAAFPQYPDSHFMVSDRWISATWITGNDYRGSGYYGAYPPSYLKRIGSMLAEGERVLHLFSGSLTEAVRGTRFDARKEVKPDVIGDAEQLSRFFAPASFDVILADPPYSHEDAEHYGMPLCNKKKVLAECHKVLAPDGLLLWMDQAIPMFSKTQWEWVGVISIYRSTMHRIRGVMWFRRNEQ